MKLKLGVIADDLTGATDIAGALSMAGLKTILVNSKESIPDNLQADALVVGLKVRSESPQAAVSSSLEVLTRLLAVGAQRVMFKYCSTFDSTSGGNIGPITDALLDAMGEQFTVLVPSLPANGRTVYQGNLFVHGVPLAESGMRNHPITPMRDSNLVRVMDAQSQGSTGLVPYEIIERGSVTTQNALTELRNLGRRYAVVDAITDTHLDTIAAAVSSFPLITGGSGIAAASARLLAGNGVSSDSPTGSTVASGGKTVILSGSASETTIGQVSMYQKLAPHKKVDTRRLTDSLESYVVEVADWVADHAGDYAPLVYATASAKDVDGAQTDNALPQKIEQFFGQIATRLHSIGFTRFIAAGGETSGAITNALSVNIFEIGSEVAPGIPWVRTLDHTLELLLKSGNFGNEDFFEHAQRTRSMRNRHNK